jgi:DNA invertase Pin-like site-specific DNA recombinase
MELAEEIRDLYSQKLYSYSQLAAMFDVAKTTISNCIKGKTWNKI